MPSGAWTGQALTKSKRRSLGQIKDRRLEAECERERASWAEADEAAKRRKRKRCEPFDETVMPLVAGLGRYRLVNPAAVEAPFHQCADRCA